MVRPRGDPYQVTIEIVNEQCKGLRMLRDSRIQQCTLIDIRGLPEGVTRHLVKIPSEQINEIPRGAFTKIRGSDKIDGQASAWFDSDGCDF